MKPGQPDRQNESSLQALQSVIWPTTLLVLSSVSVALYYNITFFGNSVVALPSLPVTMGCLLYYLSAFNTTPPKVQVILWLVCFIISGWMWWQTLIWTARRVTSKALSQASKRHLQRLLILYLPPLPWLLWVHAQSPQGITMSALQRAVLEREGLYWASYGTQAWLNGIFLVLAVAESLMTLALLNQEPNKSLKESLITLLIAAIMGLLGVSLASAILFRLHAH